MRLDFGVVWGGRFLVVRCFWNLWDIGWTSFCWIWGMDFWGWLLDVVGLDGS